MSIFAGFLFSPKNDGQELNPVVLELMTLQITARNSFI